MPFMKSKSYLKIIIKNIQVKISASFCNSYFRAMVIFSRQFSGKSQALSTKVGRSETNMNSIVPVALILHYYTIRLLLASIPGWLVWVRVLACRKSLIA